MKNDETLCNNLEKWLFDGKITESKFECKGKKPYDSKDEANKEIYRMMVESLFNTTFLRSYKCKYCHKWHLTSKN